jgi:hypothetical protein
MTLAQTILLETLGLADALWFPIRDPFCDYWAATWVLRKRYAEQGLPYRGGGSKDHERALTESVSSGWLTRRRAQRKTIGARLTRAGLVEGWRLLGMGPGTDVVIHSEVLRHGPPGAWIPETAFNHGRGWGDSHAQELRIIDFANLQALTSGLVQSNCLMKGGVCYRSTLALLPSLTAEELDADDPEADPEALNVYDTAFSGGLYWLNTQTNATADARGEIGELYLPPFALLGWQAARDASAAALREDIA